MMDLQVAMMQHQKEQNRALLVVMNKLVNIGRKIDLMLSLLLLVVHTTVNWSNFQPSIPCIIIPLRSTLWTFDDEDGLR